MNEKNTQDLDCLDTSQVTEESTQSQECGSNDTQLKMLQEIQKAGYNIVTCGQCGSALIHRIPIRKLPSEDEDIICPYCNFISDQCDFPDLFY